MRTLGLDVGTKTIGVAASDALGLTAQTVTTLRRTRLKDDLAALAELVREYEVERFVVGLPLNMDGTEGPRAEATRRFVDALTQALGLPVELWDERLSTVAAQRTLLEADLSRAKRREVIDQMAAQFILQGWLDAQRPLLPGHGDDDYDPDT
ncbi:Holliday junction resolvase RuvX [Archangium sp.]|uniref:Holliday junction resolvase RuvX n=1 Tax=Archangium sp. TaxID=1872627 RepID=UPI002D74F322|nr:Holliday junction resolvase RuvX [Archangium sp.]HYO54512.1 Holliday junction resolvase RuvX [Archangium sp.]